MSQPLKRISAANDRYVTMWRTLEPFKPYLDDPNVSEVCVNDQGGFWVERRGVSDMIYVKDDRITFERIKRFAQNIATNTSQHISETTPLLSASLPTGERVQIVLPPAAPNGIGLFIRKTSVQNMSLNDYLTAGAFENTRFISDQNIHDLKSPPPIHDAPAQAAIAKFLSDAAHYKNNILVSGGTSTGKTTLLNALLNETNLNERIVTIEDTRELHPPHKNCFNFLASKGGQSKAKVTIQDLFQAALRSRPDRILLGELRGDEAMAYLRAVNSGHPGSITTIHADNPQGAFDNIAFLVTQANASLSYENITRFTKGVLDVVIQLKRVGGKRVVSEIWTRTPQD